MITSIYRVEEDGKKTLEFEESLPGSTNATKILGIVTEVVLFTKMKAVVQ